MFPQDIKPFHAESFSKIDRFTFIGEGSLGAKANGIARARPLLDELNSAYGPKIKIDIPTMTVISTDNFDRFISDNGLEKYVSSELPDLEIEQEFRNASLSKELREDLRTFLAHIESPLAIRSSSLLEDGLNVPFAGIYDTRMIPGDQPDIQMRLESLETAIKCVFASTYYKKARQYRKFASCSDSEKMAVIIQVVIGSRFGERFYPHISGIARSYNFYPMGLSRPEDGLIGLALGLGKIIVDEGRAWYFSPAYPQANPPYQSFRDLMNLSQKNFWAINMGSQWPDQSDYLRKYQLTDAELDGTLALVASTYVAANDRVVQGISEDGPRILDFARILKTNIIPLNEFLRQLLAGCESALGTKANIEFAITVPHNIPSAISIGFLQMRPMALYDVQVDLEIDALTGNDVILASESCLGNGAIESIRDIVYIPKEKFDSAKTNEIADEVAKINDTLSESGTPYVLMGFGRWGSSDASAGIPVNFGQISGARVIAEMTLPGMDFFSSQGSHFFHNIVSHKILYMSLSYADKYKVDWKWLREQALIREFKSVRHIRTERPIFIKVDGKTRRGVITR